MMIINHKSHSMRKRACSNLYNLGFLIRNITHSLENNTRLEITFGKYLNRIVCVHLSVAMVTRHLESAPPWTSGKRSLT